MLTKLCGQQTPALSARWSRISDRLRALLLTYAAITLAMQPPQALSREKDRQADAHQLAEKLASEYSLAQAGGADLSDISGVRTAIQKLSRGIAGSGPGHGLIFQVAEAERATVRAAMRYLKFDRNVLRYDPPLDFRAAWTTGYVSKQKAATGNSLRQLMIERRAESIVRVFDTARSAGANLSAAVDTDSALKLLEQGVDGQGTQAGIRFTIEPLQRGDRARIKSLLIFHNGNLHFARDAKHLDPREIKALLKGNRPAQLAQQIVALYNAAANVEADLGDPSTPAELIEALRLGVRSSTELGEHYFRISEKATESDWRRSVAYLRLENGALSYNPPKLH